MPLLQHLTLTLCVLTITACDLFPESVGINDPRIHDLIVAAQNVNRNQLGFMPLPAAGTVRWEHRPRRGYDAMLHFDDPAPRTIAFQATTAGWRWIGEQQIFKGPRRFSTPDGDLNEQVTITYEVSPVSGVPLNMIHIGYYDDDPRFEGRRQFDLKEIIPILIEWGYEEYRKA